MATSFGQRRALGKRYAIDPAILLEIERMQQQYALAPGREARGIQAAQFERELTSRERLAEQTERASKRTKTFGDTFRQAFSPQAWGSAIANVLKFVGIYQLLYAAIDGVRELILGSAKAFIAYEDAIGKLNAITLATGEQSKILSESIRTVAVETRFTATEVAALATSLAKLGATSNEIPDLLQPIALAAQATGESLDSVGETILKVNNQFGLVAGESATTAQTLVSAINESALSLNTFNTAIQYIGPVASQVGYTFAETAEYMKVLADNGFTASRIGTGLRSIFTDLKKPGEDLTEEEIKTYCKERLADYKVPKQIVFRAELPMTPVGKIMKSKLKEEISG